MPIQSDGDEAVRELDDELAGWGRSWRESAGDAPIDVATVARLVRRRTLAFRLVAGAETVVAIGMFALLAWFARRAADGWDLVVAASLGVLCLGALVRGLQFARRHWGPSGETTADFVALMVRRGLAMRRQLRLGWGLLALELAVLGPWIAHTLRRRHGVPVPFDAAVAAWSYLAVVAAGAALLLVLLRRRNERELARWTRLRAEAGDPEG